MTQKRTVKHPKKLAVFLVKVTLFIILFLLFFTLLAVENPQISRLSRTAAITMTTFVVLGIATTAVYGGFAVGKKKSKEIIPPLCIAVFITDFITGFQLEIMKMTELHSNPTIWPDVGTIIIAFLWQCVAVTAFVYFGNFVYFKLNPPENCLVICGNIDNKDDITKRIEGYKKQYKITAVADFATIAENDLKKLIRDNDAVFLYEVPNDSKSAIIDYAYKHYTSIYMQTDLSDIVINYAKHFVLDDLSMLGSTTKELSVEQRFLKRTIDIVISGVGLLILSPIILVEAIAIKCYDKGPVFFKQKRVTLNGKIFEVLKFRTMVVNADSIEGYHPAGENDDRITPVGRILRKTRLDEIPQLINILLGDMSIVGPRPERVEHVEKYTQELPEFSYRLRAKAGLTGLAQIAGKYNTSPKDKLILDLMYIEKYSVWMDITLIFQTLKVFFKSDSTEAFSEEKVNQFIEYQTEDPNFDDDIIKK